MTQQQSMQSVLAKLFFGLIVATLVLIWLIWTFQDAGPAIKTHLGPQALFAPVNGGKGLGGTRVLLQHAIGRVRQALPIMNGLMVTTGIAMVLVPARWEIRTHLLITGMATCVLSLAVLLPVIWPWVAQVG